jgi:hypothetical protein
MVVRLRWLFDFPLLFSLLICNVYHCPICFLLFNFSPNSINLLFHSLFIYRSFYSLQFSHLIAISHMFGFSFWSLFLKIYNFVINTFIEFFSFNFIFQSKFLLFYLFQFDPHFFYFFPFIKVVFQFN